MYYKSCRPKEKYGRSSMWCCSSILRCRMSLCIGCGATKRARMLRIGLDSFSGRSSFRGRSRRQLRSFHRGLCRASNIWRWKERSFALISRRWLKMQKEFLARIRENQVLSRLTKSKSCSWINRTMFSESTSWATSFQIQWKSITIYLEPAI